MNDARPIGTNGYKLLVVDDNDLILQLVSRLLRREGFDVATASDGYAALDWCEMNGQPDFLLTDVCMPGLDGPTLYRKLSHRFPDLPVLFMSATPEVAQEDETAPLLEKPFRSEQLTAMISASLHGESPDSDTDGRA